jgi:hypothetical protein
MTLADRYPDVMRITELADVLRCSVRTIERDLQRHDWTRIPQPAWCGPYRWRRADVERFIELASVSLQRRARLQALHLKYRRG